MFETSGRGLISSHSLSPFWRESCERTVNGNKAAPIIQGQIAGLVTAADKRGPVCVIAADSGDGAIPGKAELMGSCPWHGLSLLGSTLQ